LLASVTRPVDVVEKPFELGPGQVRVEHQARTLPKQRFLASFLELLAAIGGSSVLPDDSLVNRPAGVAIPQHRRLALVGDTDAEAGGRIDPSLLERGPDGLRNALPDLVEVVFDPARSRKMLRKLPVGAAQDPSLRR
jgi:hypothetical protein